MHPCRLNHVSRSDVVEAHATVLNGMDRLLSNHVAKKNKLVRCMFLDPQGQNVSLICLSLYIIAQQPTCFVTSLARQLTLSNSQLALCFSRQGLPGQMQC